MECIVSCFQPPCLVAAPSSSRASSSTSREPCLWTSRTTSWRIRAISLLEAEHEQAYKSGRRRRLRNEEQDAETFGRNRMSNRKLWHYIVDQLESGISPVALLENMKQWRPGEFWHVVGYLKVHKRIDEALQAFEWWKKQPGYRPREEHFVRYISMVGKAGMPDEAQKIFNDMEALNVKPTVVAFTALLQCYAEQGNFQKAEDIMKEMLERGLKPNVVTYGGLIRALGKRGLYDEMAKVFNTMKTVNCAPDIFTYRHLMEAYSRGGLVGRMEKVFKGMVKDGWRPDSASLNIRVQGYAAMGMIKEMEKSYSYFHNLKKSATEATIRAVALAYIRQNQFYQMGEFVKSLGMKRASVGNLLWNLVLLSNAANFSMKTLQREFENMQAAKFEPDLMTFNIRALAFSRMQMFWDLHVLVLHMQSLAVTADVATYGAVVDAYIAEGLEEKLPEALDELQMLECIPDVRTDPLVFEAFGKGRFHVFCEDYMYRGSSLSYSTLTTCYLELLSKRKRSKDNSKWEYPTKPPG